jgi:hypothetical protein
VDSGAGGHGRSDHGAARRDGACRHVG